MLDQTPRRNLVSSFLRTNERSNWSFFLFLPFNKKDLQKQATTTDARINDFLFFSSFLQTHWEKRRVTKKVFSSSRYNCTTSIIQYSLAHFFSSFPLVFVFFSILFDYHKICQLCNTTSASLCSSQEEKERKKRFERSARQQQHQQCSFAPFFCLVCRSFRFVFLYLSWPFTLHFWVERSIQY